MEPQQTLNGSRADLLGNYFVRKLLGQLISKLDEQEGGPAASPQYGPEGEAQLPLQYVYELHVALLRCVRGGLDLTRSVRLIQYST